MSVSVAPTPSGWSVWRELRRLSRFCAVGALNTVLALAAFVVLTLIGVPPAAASALGFALGATSGYHLNVRWTFAGATRNRTRVGRYVAVQLFGAGLSALGEAVGRAGGLGRLGAEVVLLPVVTLVLYVLSRRLVFTDPHR
jgi:putative flippase GtrA